MMWRPINEIGQSKSKMVVAAGPRGVTIQPRHIAEMTRDYWSIFHDLAPLPSQMVYVLSEDDYEVMTDDEPRNNE